jgi:methylthioribose-1-phosphate isomerase
LIPIEERNPAEVLNLEIAGQSVAPAGSTARNPAFDVTPNRLLSAIVTEKGIVYPPFKQNLVRIVTGN